MDRVIQWSALEREDLCALALRLGPHAPTLCSGWSVDDLITHLCVREHSILGAGALLVPALRQRLGRATARWAARGFPERVEAIRQGGRLPTLGTLGERVHLLEFVVHHQDLARANAVTTPRRPHGHSRAVLTQVRHLRHRLGRSVPPGTGLLLRDPRCTSLDLRRGPTVVTVLGPAVELALWACGRGEYADVTVTVSASEDNAGDAPRPDLAGLLSSGASL